MMNSFNLPEHRKNEAPERVLTNDSIASRVMVHGYFGGFQPGRSERCVCDTARMFVIIKQTSAGVIA